MRLFSHVTDAFVALHLRQNKHFQCRPNVAPVDGVPWFAYASTFDRKQLITFDAVFLALSVEVLDNVLLVTAV